MATVSGLIHRAVSICRTAGNEDAGDGWIAGEPAAVGSLLGLLQLENKDDGGEEGFPPLTTSDLAVAGALEKARRLESLVSEVFHVVSAVKKAYVGLQEAHVPWDPDRMRVADEAMVTELRRLGQLRDHFRRSSGSGEADINTSAATAASAATLRDAVLPYEAALDELKKQIKSKDLELKGLREQVKKTAAARKKGRLLSGKRIMPLAATPELFAACMKRVQAASRSFSGHLLSLMRAAEWDIAAAVLSITGVDIPASDARYALESHAARKLFHGFENETFYMEGTLASLLRPADHRRECFSQFRDMGGMNPAELLGVLPSCPFGRFAGKKYLAVVRPEVEESLFGGLEQGRIVAAGGHPRTAFFGEFLRLAKAVWLLHLLAFSLDPPPGHFEAAKGAEFHPGYMDSVVRFAGGGVPTGSAVAFSVMPGFKLGDGTVVKARVYVDSRG